MRFWQRIKRPARPADLPPDIYLSLVANLYSDSRTLFIGSMAASVLALITAFRVNEPLIYACAVAIAAVACIRALDMRAFARQRAALTADTAAIWEMRYVTGAAAYVALLGTWCLVAFARTSDEFVHLVSFSTTLAYLVGISGRNFASSRLVNAQIIFASIPMVGAVSLTRDPAYLAFGLILVPFFASLKFISDRLRRTLLDAVIATRDVSLLANRFDTALNNMPHGLCMFDPDGSLVVFNRRLVELLGVQPDVFRRSPSIRDLLRNCAQIGTIAASSVDRVANEFASRLAGTSTGELVIDIRDDRTLVFTFQAMDNGGSVVLAEDVTERKNTEAKIQYLARYDALTGLFNRTSFHEQMERVLASTRRGGTAAVLFVDLDQFKQVNDTLGHPVGDRLLCAVAERLRGIVRESDIIARFGGDEFVVLQYPASGPDQAASLARRIVDVLGTTYEIDGNQVVIGASIGIALAPGDGRDVDLLLKNADMALYRAKSDGRAGWRFFEPDMDVKAQARRNLELDLRNAIANDAFELYYQPIFDLTTRHVSTCEALLRWPHPERGMVSPAEFIPIAEEMGLIVEIGQRVLNKACMECTKWPSDVRVAVNLSPIQFRRGGVTTAVRHALTLSGLHPSRLEIEITESALLHDTQATRVSLQQIRDLGVRISLDDFGTGYSSLSYLHSFPFHKVKIDRSFLQGIETSERSLTLLYGVAHLSAQLGLSVVMEGVETQEQLGLIARQPSINEAQGYLFSRPVASRDIRKLLYARTSLEERVA